MKIAVHHALSEFEAERSWTCSWCDRMVEENRETARLCRQCQWYQEDLDAGIFGDVAEAAE